MITHTNKDIISKVLTQNYQNKSLAVYGLTDLPRIKRMLSPDFPVVTATEFYGDNLFLLEDDSLLVLEYESKPVWQDFLKYGKYAIFAVERLLAENIQVKKVIIAVLYTGDVQKTANQLDLGSFCIQVEQVYLSQFDTDAIYTELEAKIERNEPLTDEDVMKFIILPLTQPDKKRKQGLIVDTVTLAKKISDDMQQSFILAGIITATDKFIDPAYADKIKEWLRMAKVVRMLIDEEVEIEVQKAKREKSIEFAKKLLKRGFSIEAIMEDTELDEATIRSLQT